MKEGGRRKDRLRIMLGIVVSAIVILSVGTYFLYASPWDFSEVMLVAIAVILVVFALFMFWNRAKSYKSGLPAEDEMSRKTLQKAGYYAWLISIYAILFSRVIGEDVAEATGSWEIVGSYMTVGGIVIPAVAFFVLYLWFGRSGDV